MTIDDVIEQLNELRAKHGNVEVTIRDQSHTGIFNKGIRMRHRVAYGKLTYTTYFDVPTSGDVKIGIVVLSREIY